jgi:hypothetical protein
MMAGTGRDRRSTGHGVYAGSYAVPWKQRRLIRYWHSRFGSGSKARQKTRGGIRDKLS